MTIFFTGKLADKGSCIRYDVASEFAASMRTMVESLFIFDSFRHVCGVVCTLHRVERKLLSTAPTADETVVARDAIRDVASTHFLKDAHRFLRILALSKNEAAVCHSYNE